jgi:hypothetical protein
MTNSRLKAQDRFIKNRLLWAPHIIYQSKGGDKLFAKHLPWGQLGKNVVYKERVPSNIVNINTKPSAIEHNERVNNLNKQFHVKPTTTGSEAGLVNLLLGSFLKGTSPENVVFPKNGFGSEFLRDSPQVIEALTKYANLKGNDGKYLDKLEDKANTPRIIDSFRDAFKLKDFIGSVDYSIKKVGDLLTVTLTNVTSLTSGTLGKELETKLFGTTHFWPEGKLKGSIKGDDTNTNYTQTFSLTFKLEDLKQYEKKK